MGIARAIPRSTEKGYTAQGVRARQVLSDKDACALVAQYMRNMIWPEPIFVLKEETPRKASR